MLDRLDPEQRAVATSLGGPVAVIAGAGTGKTRAITHRIAYAVATGVYAPTSVLAVTFTTRAAGEMRGRLQRLGIAGVQARTFHSAALRQAQYFWPKAYGSDLPPVLDNRYGVIAEAASRLRLPTAAPGLRDLMSEISWAKVSNVTPDSYLELAGSRGRELASFDAETVARAFAAYEEVKRERQRIDFEDILLCTAAMIAEHDRVATEIRRTYRHLVVDEYQDVSPLQQALLDLWRGDSQDLCVVGDPAQTIHSFAGAQAGFLTGFAKRHPGSTVIRLIRDYRSTPQVVRVANRVLQRARPADGGQLGSVQLEAQRESGPEPVFADAADEASEAADVADWLASLHKGGIEYREMAVLFRVNAQSPAFEQALADRDVPYLVRGGERFYERPEVRQALITLRTQARIAASGESTEPDSRSAAEQVKLLLGSMGWTDQPPSGTGAVRERWESLAALVSVADDLVRQQPGCTLADVVVELQRRADAQHVPSADGVTVSTLHSAKGLEWEAVAVVGVSEGSLPFVLATTPDEVEEERRLFYVGVTRAKTRLRISWARTRNGSGERRPSRFIDGVRPGSGATRPNGPVRSARRTSTALAATCRSCGRHLNDAAERKLGRHAGCPASYDEPTLERLRTWRKSQAETERVPAYCVFTDATLLAIAEARPRTARELIKVTGVGATKISKYGADLLEVVNDS
ncbi:ATP-dependent DNA helicase UvrD2 [Microlunatus elymi]|uniref:DNA 3'-5' helicase n=1 Tax=Microlunatus elymi TaxID=2596828 RepID=A0A516Q5N2_9ACTN|nr:ATP-dependent DNA helicase UvrD2 [Microlunatus elymi]